MNKMKHKIHLLSKKHFPRMGKDNIARDNVPGQQFLKHSLL